MASPAGPLSRASRDVAVHSEVPQHPKGCAAPQRHPWGCEGGGWVHTPQLVLHEQHWEEQGSGLGQGKPHTGEFTSGLPHAMFYAISVNWFILFHHVAVHWRQTGFGGTVGNSGSKSKTQPPSSTVKKINSIPAQTSTFSTPYPTPFMSFLGPTVSNKS